MKVMFVSMPSSTLNSSSEQHTYMNNIQALKFYGGRLKLSVFHDKEWVTFMNLMECICLFLQILSLSIINEIKDI